MRTFRTLAVAGLATVFFQANAFAVGTWDLNATLVGINANGDYIGGEEVRVKKTDTGSSGCAVVKFKPGQGNIPATAAGAAARDRIYAAALAALMAGSPVSIWVYDTTNCYGVMLVVGDGVF